MPTDYAVNHVEKNIIRRRRTTNEKKRSFKRWMTDSRSTINKAKLTKMHSPSRPAYFMKPEKFQNALKETQILPGILKNKDLELKLF